MWETKLNKILVSWYLLPTKLFDKIKKPLVFLLNYGLNDTAWQKFARLGARAVLVGPILPVLPKKQSFLD